MKTFEFQDSKNNAVQVVAEDVDKAQAILREFMANVMAPSVKVREMSFRDPPIMIDKSV